MAPAPYQKTRHNADGGARHYWVRPGFQAQPLTGTAAERDRQAAEWNRRARGGDAPKAARRPGNRRPRKDPRSIAYWIEQYRATDHFQQMARNTRVAFKREGDKLHDTLGSHRIDQVTRRVCKRYVAMRPKSMRSQALCVLRGVLEAACDAGLIEDNPAYGIRVEASTPRKQIWTEADVAAFMAAGPKTVPRQWPAIRRGVLLLLYLGQRVGDVLQLRYTAYDGEFIDLTQQKTGEDVSVYCHRALRAELDADRPSFARTPMVLTRDGRPYSYQGFYTSFRKIRDAAGLQHLRIHDLRRTAVCNMLAAGIKLEHICMVTGHSPQSIRVIWRHYVAHQREITKAAILQLEDYKSPATGVGGNADMGTSGNAE